MGAHTNLTSVVAYHDSKEINTFIWNRRSKRAEKCGLVIYRNIGKLRRNVCSPKIFEIVATSRNNAALIILLP